MNLPRSYDAWRLAGPDDESDGAGEYEGQPCNRFPEPDEDAPRNYRPRRCKGVMTTEAGYTSCNICGAEGYDDER